MESTRTPCSGTSRHVTSRLCVCVCVTSCQCAGSGADVPQRRAHLWSCDTCQCDAAWQNHQTCGLGFQSGARPRGGMHTSVPYCKAWGACSFSMHANAAQPAFTQLCLLQLFTTSFFPTASMHKLPTASHRLSAILMSRFSCCYHATLAACQPYECAC